MRYPVLLILILLGGFVFSNPGRIAAVLNSFDLYFEDSALQRSNYGENGFVCGFTMNVLSLRVSVPQDYSEEKVSSALEPYSFTDCRNQELFDVIVVLSESFFDIRNWMDWHSRRIR